MQQICKALPQKQAQVSRATKAKTENAESAEKVQVDVFIFGRFTESPLQQTKLRISITYLVLLRKRGATEGAEECIVLPPNAPLGQFNEAPTVAVECWSFLSHICCACGRAGSSSLQLAYSSSCGLVPDKPCRGPPVHNQLTARRRKASWFYRPAACGTAKIIRPVGRLISFVTSTPTLRFINFWPDSTTTIVPSSR